MKRIDHRPAAENLRGNNETGRYGFIFDCKLCQVKALVSQVDEVSGMRITLMQKADNVFRIIGHQQIKAFLIQYFFLTFKGLHDPGYKVIQMLQAECAGDQVSEKEFGQPENGASDIIFMPEIAILDQQVEFSYLGNDDGKVVLVDISVVCVDHILDTV